MGGRLLSAFTPAAADRSHESATIPRTPTGTAPRSSRSSRALRTSGSAPRRDSLGNCAGVTMINLRSSVPPAGGQAGMLHYRPAEQDDVRSKVPETAAIGQQLRLGEGGSGFRYQAGILLAPSGATGRYLWDARYPSIPSNACD